MELRSDLTVGKLLRESAAMYPDRPALRNREKVLTYKQLDEAVDLAARRLLTCGIKHGDHVGVLCENRPTLVMIIYALARIGAVNVMYNTSLSRAELINCINRSHIHTLIVGDGYKNVNFPELVAGIRPSCHGLDRLIYLARGANKVIEHLNDIEPASEEALAEAEAAVKPEDTAQILFTSGTTSYPKMVMGSHYSRANAGRFQAKDLEATCEDVFLMALPAFHCFSLSVNVMASCAVGACLFIPESRRTAVLLSDIRDFHCTVLSCVPTLFLAILHRQDFAKWDISSLRAGFVGGAGCTPKQFEEMEKGMGMTFVSSLGQTEATGGITTADLDDPVELRAVTVGHMMDHLEGKIVNIDTGETCPQGVTGEICVRGYVVMQGYYNNPEATAKAIDGEGWLHTGDLGWFDEKGYLHLDGRLKELIIRGGENISPAEVEIAAIEDPQIESCRAVGVPDDHYGQQIALCVILAKGSTRTADQIIERLRERLAYYKVPKYVLFFKKFPENSMGKTDSKALLQETIKRLGQP